MGQLDTSPIRSAEPAVVLVPVKFVGGAGAVTKVFGRDVTVNYISAGIVDLAFGESHGLFLGVLGHTFEATTQSALKGYSVVPGVYNTSTNKLRLNICADGGAGAPALTDLAVLQWLTLLLAFSQVGSGV